MINRNRLATTLILGTILTGCQDRDQRIDWLEWIRNQEPGPGSYGGVGHGDREWGAVLYLEGEPAAEWGNPDYAYQTASVGKAFTHLALLLAIDEGRVASLDSLLSDYWTGRGTLSSPSKYLDSGFHRSLTFRHIVEHRSGFAVSNGDSWSRHIDVPAWAHWTGNPADDNWSQLPPGSERRYSSGAYWRLTQVLTSIWGDDLKAVLDRRIMSKIGIEPDSWRWLSGREVREKSPYPLYPNYGTFVDEPFSINGHECLGGGGWVVISASNLAKVGLLILNRGLWGERRIVSDDEILLKDHRGANNSGLIVDRGRDAILSYVTTENISLP